MKTPWAAALLLPGSLAAQQPDTSATVTFGGFVDGYYAHQLERSAPGDMPFLTQPGRNNEFNINLAFVEAKLSGDRIRGRLALQTGTSVALNYAAEPRSGLASGPDLQRHIQEAVVGYRLGKQLWVDGGIYLSHIGSEDWISRDNWTYTRSLVAEFSPYYESGVKLTWSPGKLTALFTIVNGWQNISENNAAKSVGVRFDYTVTSRLSLGYSNLFGNEAPDSVRSRFRFFNDLYGKVMLSDKFGMTGTFDFGVQTHTIGTASAKWRGYSIVARDQASRMVALVGRWEWYSDPNQAIVNASGGFRSKGLSLGLDVAPESRLLWRTELRSFAGGSTLFVADESGGLSKRMSFLVTSLALTL